MRRHLDTLRAQPQHVRKQVAFGASAIITFFVFMFWLSSGTVFSSEKPVVVQNASATSTGPLTASVVGAWDSIASLPKNIFRVFSNNHTYTAPPDVVEVVSEGGATKQ
ncbi:MAG: hypothetical protein HZA80_01820 [Candidatus Taylorbacteria bacterium]|nr:hypothetical protein [Candidatus Taylorbacteria bacterium]